MESRLLHEGHTGRIIGVYYDVFNRLSQTYPEFIYERAMMALLSRQGIRCVRQDEYEIRYKQRLVGLQRLDLFVADEVVVELKIAEDISPLHVAQLLSYLKTVDKEVGLLLRFGGPRPEFIRRILSKVQPGESSFAVPPGIQQGLLHPELVYSILGGLFEVFQTLGPGYIHRIYTNACYYELSLRGLEVQPHHEFHVFLDNLNLGAIKFGHLQVDQRVLVFPVAISSLDQIQISNLKAWMRHLQIPIGIIANFRATTLKPVILRV